MWREEYFTSVIFLPKTNDISLIMRKTLDKLKLRDILQKSDQSKGHQGQEKTENCYRLCCYGGMMTKCNVASWIKSSNSKKAIKENWWHLNKSLSLVNGNVPILVLSCDKCTLLRKDDDNRGNWMKGIWELSVPSLQLFFFFLTSLLEYKCFTMVC